MPDKINRKDILNEVKELKTEVREYKNEVKEYKSAFDRHLEIYSNNGKEAARLATNVENLIKTVERVEKAVGNSETKTEGQGIDMSAIKTDVDWLKRFFWVVITATVGSVIAAIINIIKVIRS